MKIWTPIVDTYQGGASKRFAFFAVVLGALLLAALVFVFAVLPGMAVSANDLGTDQRLQRESDARTAGLQALAGLVVAIGGSFTAFSVLSNREGQLDERFARALELLASEDPYIARGAIYSLERIAAQSVFDRAAVVEVLAGFIKDSAPEGSQQGSADPVSVRQEALDALAVLGRLKEMSRSPAPDLEKTDWRGGSLGSQNLSGMRLSQSQFQDADLHKAKLAKADLFRANLNDANLREADLRAADLSQADLGDADLSGSRLENANLENANLDGALLDEKTKLTGAELSRASLKDALIFGTDLSGVDLASVTMTGAKYQVHTRFPQGFNPEDEEMTRLGASDGETPGGGF